MYYTRIILRSWYCTFLRFNIISGYSYEARSFSYAILCVSYMSEVNARYVMCLTKSKFILALGRRFFSSRLLLCSQQSCSPLSFVQAVWLYRLWEEIYQTRNKRIPSQEEVMSYIRKAATHSWIVIVNEDEGL
jgi:hypothetical protein